MFIQSDTIDDLMRRCHQNILEHGIRQRASRGDFTGIQGVLLELTNPISRISRTETRGKIISCIGELIWILSGSNSLHSIAPYFQHYAEESEDNTTVNGAYGPRIFAKNCRNQFDIAFETLTKRPSSRRAVIQVLEPKDMVHDKQEIPCTMSLQFRIINNNLNLITTMRSNDAFLGLPHDVFVFTMIQEIMAKKLGVELGAYKHFAGDLHIYDEHLVKVEQFLQEGYASKSPQMPPMPSFKINESLQALVESERMIREDCDSNEIKDKFSKLNSYWLDLASFIGILHAKKSRNSEKLKNYISFIKRDSYKVYIKDRCNP